MNSAVRYPTDADGRAGRKRVSAVLGRSRNRRRRPPSVAHAQSMIGNLWGGDGENIGNRSALLLSFLPRSLLSPGPRRGGVACPSERDIASIWAKLVFMRGTLRWAENGSRSFHCVYPEFV